MTPDRPSPWAPCERVVPLAGGRAAPMQAEIWEKHVAHNLAQPTRQIAPETISKPRRPAMRRRGQ